MKKISIHLLVTFFMLTSYNNLFSQCTSCSLSGPSEINLNQTRTFSTSTLSGANYFWSTTGGLTIVGSNTSYSVSVKGTTAGSGKICVTRYKNGSEPCCYCRTINIKPPCTVPSVSIAQEPFGCQGDVLTFNAVLNPSNASGSYNWNVSSGGTIIGSNSNKTLNVQSSTSFGFSISLTFTSTCNNTQVNAFTLAQFLDCGFIISPNPSSDMLIVQPTTENDKATKPYSVEVIDQNGEVQLKAKVNKDNNQIDISNLPNDLYFVRVVMNGKVIKTTKLIKK